MELLVQIVVLGCDLHTGEPVLPMGCIGKAAYGLQLHSKQQNLIVGCNL